MKAKWTAVFVGAVLATTTLVYAQDASTTDANKSSSTGSKIKQDTKTAAKDTGKGVKTAAKDTGKGVETGAKDTGKGAKVVGKDTEKGAKTVGKDTGKAADKTGKAIEKPFKKKDTTSSDTKPATSSN
jgi:hypothetical protein